MEIFLIVSRTLHFAATISLTGVFACACLVAGPAIAAGDADAVAARLDRRLRQLAWASLALAVLSGMAWLIAVAAEISARPLAAVLAEGVWATVLTRTRFGVDWLVRLGLAGLVGGVLLAAGRRPAEARGGVVGWIGLALAAVMLASLAWAGHGGATPGMPGDLHLASDVLHLLAAGVWLGALPPFALLLAETGRVGDASAAAVARVATRRFSVLAAASVAVLLAAGLVNTWFLAGTVPALIGTVYGRLLLAKIALFLAMLMLAVVNLLRLAPRLSVRDPDAGDGLSRTVRWLRRNALIEATIGLAVLAIVGVLGILPPGLHSEPGWPLPFRLDPTALTPGGTILLAALAVLAGVCAIAAAAAAAAARYRRMAGFAGGLVLCLFLAWMPLHSAVEPAYPTSFYTPAEPYDAASIARGGSLYAENCALCHGVGGRGNGPAAAGLGVHPADLTEPHLFAHSPGDLFWWVSRGMGDGAMPGFAGVMTPDQRWDAINFIRARAAGILARRIGPRITTAVSPAVPDFAFEMAGRQQTLSGTLADGPVLLVLFQPPAPVARLAALAEADQALDRAKLRVVAVEIGKAAPEPENGLPLVVGVSPDVGAALAPFGALGGEDTELLLDRGGHVRARWTADSDSGLPDAATLVADAESVARLAVTEPSHAGHAH